MMSSVLVQDSPYMMMVVNILRAGNIIDRKVSEVLKDYSITHIQYNILRILEKAYPEKLSVGEITEGLLFSSSDVTRLLDRLDRKKLITRTICPKNRRKMDVIISDRGLEVLSDAEPKIEKKLNRYYADRVSEQERNLITDVLRRLKDE